MSGALMDKVWGLFGMDSAEPEEYEDEDIYDYSIKEIRKSKGLTQEQLSEMIDIETSSLSGIESGRFYPSLHVLEKIASVFDVELIEFFKFSSVNLPENLDKAIFDIIERQDKNNKRLIYKLLAAAFVTIS